MVSGIQTDQAAAEATWTDLHQLMVRMRALEQRIESLYSANEVKGPVHLGLGMEGVAAGFALAMQKEDYTLCSYRGHTHTLGRGVDMTSIVAELLGRRGGLLHGKGGSMPLASERHRVLGSNAIVGAQLVIAIGPAWSSQVRGDDAVTVCFFGDGTTNIGAFHEALNLAAVWQLPIIFVCENNLYMEYTLTSEVTAVAHPAADRAAAYGLSREIIDGNDAMDVHSFAIDALSRCRSGKGPVLVEALTYRTKGHSVADPGKYRPEQELEEWSERDPIARAREAILALGGDLVALDRAEHNAADEVNDAVEAAYKLEEPHPDDLYSDVWADGGSTWRR
jgi:TPP-dependent pyruvate/acetoin dehydrogenase alpha subunit